MEQNNVGLDSQSIEIANAGFVMGEEPGIEPLKVEFSGPGTGIWKSRRLHVVERHPFGENQKSHLVEWIVCECGERADFEIAVAIQPVVNGRTEREVRRAIGVCK